MARSLRAEYGGFADEARGGRLSRDTMVGSRGLSLRFAQTPGSAIALGYQRLDGIYCGRSQLYPQRRRPRFFRSQHLAYSPSYQRRKRGLFNRRENQIEFKPKNQSLCTFSRFSLYSSSWRYYDSLNSYFDTR